MYNKKVVSLFLSLIISNLLMAQGIFGKINKAINGDSSSKEINKAVKRIDDYVYGSEADSSYKEINKAVKQIDEYVYGSDRSSLTEQDIINGLKEALTVGTQNSTKKLGVENGFFNDAVLKIIMPSETEKIASTMRKLGMGSLVDKAELSMNRAAEDATAGVGELFIDAIKKMTIKDGLEILKGDSVAATRYLKTNTSQQLAEKIKPIIEASLKKVNATKYWSDVFTNYNKYLHQNVNTDLTAYVSDKTSDAIFYSISQEESKIRKDPKAQVSDLLKRVFGK